MRSASFSVVAPRATPLRAMYTSFAVSGDDRSVANDESFNLSPRSGIATILVVLAQYEHLPIYKQTYDQLLRIMTATKNFPREYKYTLGQKLKDEVIELVVLKIWPTTRNIVLMI